MILMNFQQLKKKKRLFYSLCGVPKINLLIYKVQKMGKTHIWFCLISVKMLLFSKHLTYIKILTSVRKYLSVKICIIQTEVNWFAIQINGLVSKWDEVLLKGFFEQALINKPKSRKSIWVNRSRSRSLFQKCVLNLFLIRS